MSMVYCRGCGHSIHDSAVQCPQCGAQQGQGRNEGPYTSMEQVPVYRRNWFVILCFLLFWPACLVIVFTGDVYYSRGGEIRTYGPGVKVALVALCALWGLMIFSGV